MNGHGELPLEGIPLIDSQNLWRAVKGNEPPLNVDVREPRECHRGHIPGAQLIPLPKLLADQEIPRHRPVVFVCRSGQRSIRAAAMLRQNDHDNVKVLDRGVQAWERDNLLEAVQYGQQAD